MASDPESDFDLGAAVEFVRIRLGKLSPGDRQKLGTCVCLAGLLQDQFQETQRIACLDEAIEVLRDAIADPALGPRVDQAAEAQLGGLLFARFQETSMSDDRDDAIELLTAALPALADNGSEVQVQMRTYYLKALEVGLYHRYTANKRVNARVPFEDMEAALRYGNLALLGPDADHGRAEYLSHMAMLSWEAFQDTDDVGFIDKAIQHLRRSLDFKDAMGSYETALRLMNLSEFAWALYQRSPAPELLDQTILAGQEAAAEDPTALPCDFWHKLSWRLKLRHEASQSMKDLDDAIKYAERAVELAPDTHADRSSYLKNLASRLRSKYLVTKSVDDLNAVINVNRKALDAAPASGIVRVGILTNLGLSLSYRFERKSQPGGLDECVQYLKESVALSSPDDEDWGRRMANLITRILKRNSGQEVEKGKVALIFPDYDRVYEAAKSQSTITKHAADAAEILKALYEQTGNATTLDDAICLSLEAQRATPDGDAARPSTMILACALLQQKAELRRDLDSVEAAIAHWKAAVDIDCPPPDYTPQALFGLSSALLVKHTIWDDDEVSMLCDSMRAALSGLHSAAPDDPRKGEYWRHLWQFPGIEPIGPPDSFSELEQKHVCRNCEVLRATIGPAPVTGDATMKKLVFNQQTGRLEAEPLTLEDAAVLPESLKRLAREDANSPVQAGTSTQVHMQHNRPIGDIRHGRGVRVMDISEIKNKAPLPEQAVFYSERFFRENSLSDLDLAISIQTFVIDNTSSDHPKQATYHANLAGWLHARYEKTHVAEDLDQTIEYGRLSLKGELSSSQERADRHNNMAVFYGSRFEARGNASDLEQAISHCRNALGATTERKPNGSKFRGAMRKIFHPVNSQKGKPALEITDSKLEFTLAVHLHQRFRLYAERSDIEEAITLLQHAAEQTQSSKSRGFMFNNLGYWHMEMYHAFGSKRDLDLAISMGRSAEASCRDCPQYLPHTRFGVALALFFKFEVTSQMEDLQSAIQIATEISNGEPAGEDEDADNRPSWLAALGNWLCVRGLITVDTHDFNESVRMCRKAISSQPQGSSKTAYLLKNLGHSLGMRYQHTDRVQDVEEAIATIERASRIEAIAKSAEAVSDEFKIPDGLDTLGTLYFCRFNALGARRDLDESIRLGEESFVTDTKAMFPGHPRKCQALINLGNRYGLRYLRYGDVEDLQQATSLTLRAVEESEAAGTNTMTAAMPSLSRWVLLAAEVLQDSAMLRRHITTLEARLQRCPKENSRSRAEILSVLARFYLAVSKIEQKPRAKEDLEQAQLLAAAAVELIPSARSMQRCEGLTLLAEILREAHRSAGESSTTLLEAAANKYLEASRVAGAPVVFQLVGALSAGEVFADLGRWEDSTLAFQAALSVLPGLAPQSIDRGDQEDALRRIGNLSSSAAAAAIRAGKEPSFALLQLESGRGVISSLLIRARCDLSSLEAAHPDIAERYETLRSRNARPPHTLDSVIAPVNPAEDTIGKVQENLRELEVLENMIRGLPGFETFQSQLSLEDLSRLASAGTLVSFNVSKWGSNAFCVTKDGKVRSIPLPELTKADLQSNLQHLIGEERLAFGTPTSRPARNKRLRDILGWLWNAAVEPVLQALDLMSPSKDDLLPRLFWVASGPMGSMPLHAAGDFKSGDKHVSKYVVSTYVPTLKSLDYARRVASRQRHSLDDLQSLIVVGQEPQSGGSGPDLRALNIQQEIAMVEKATATAQLKQPKVSTQTSKIEILKEVEGHTIVHFTCHGKSCPDSPSDSGLFVGEGAEPETPQLRVRDLATLSYKNAWLAFISACSTAEISAQPLVDEAIHVASAFQIAGFPNVIGTMWEAEDRASVAIASLFYQRLFKSLRSSQNWDDAVAYALHDAVETLKAEGLPGSRRKISLHNDLLAWAQFIHIGI